MPTPLDALWDWFWASPIAYFFAATRWYGLALVAGLAWWLWDAGRALLARWRRQRR